MNKSQRTQIAQTLLAAAAKLSGGHRHSKVQAVALQSLSDLRRALKAIGYGLKTKSYSEFTGSTYVRLSDKVPFPDLFFGEEDLLKWKPLIDFLAENKAAIKEIGKAEGVTGLVKGVSLGSVSAARKPTPKQQKKIDDKRIEQAYYKVADGVTINMMDIPKVFKVGEEAIANGADDAALEKAVSDFVQKIKVSGSAKPRT